MNPATKLFTVPNLLPLAQPIDVDAMPERGIRTTVAPDFVETRHGAYRVRVPRTAGMMVPAKISGEGFSEISADARAILSDSRKFGQDVFGYELAKKGESAGSGAGALTYLYSSKWKEREEKSFAEPSYTVKSQYDELKSEGGGRCHCELTAVIVNKLNQRYEIRIDSSGLKGLLASRTIDVASIVNISDVTVQILDTKIHRDEIDPDNYVVAEAALENLSLVIFRGKSGTKQDGLIMTVHLGMINRGGAKLRIKAISIEGKTVDGQKWDSLFNSKIPLVIKDKINSHLFNVHIGDFIFQTEYTLNSDVSALEQRTSDANVKLTADPLGNYSAALLNIGGKNHRVLYNDNSEMLALTPELPIVKLAEPALTMDDEEGEALDIQFPVLNIPNSSIEIVFGEDDQFVIRNGSQILDLSNDAFFKRIDDKTFIFNPDFENPYSYQKDFLAVRQLSETEYMIIPITTDEFLGVNDFLECEDANASPAVADSERVSDMGSRVDVGGVEIQDEVDDSAEDPLSTTDVDTELPDSDASSDVMSSRLDEVAEDIPQIDESELEVKEASDGSSDVTISQTQQWHRDVIEASGFAPILNSLQRLHDVGVIGRVNLSVFANFFDLLTDPTQTLLDSACAFAEGNASLDWSQYTKEEVREFITSNFKASDFVRYTEARRAGVSFEDVSLFFESGVNVADFQMYKQDLPYLKKALNLGFDRNAIPLIKSAADLGIADEDLAVYLADPVEVGAVYSFAKQTGDVRNYKWIYQISGQGGNVSVFVSAWMRANESESPDLQQKIQDLAVRSSHLDAANLEDLVAEFQEFNAGQQNSMQTLRRLKYY